MTKFTVIDSIMGSGKTQYIIQKMNEDSDIRKFIYITPYLDEIERVKNSVTTVDMKAPDNRNDEGRKLKSLKMLVETDANIASTHALLQTADSELVELIKERGYTLVIDEVMDVIETVNISNTDVQRLIKNNDIEVDESGKVTWIGTDDFETRFKDIFLLSKAGTLFYSRNSMMVKIFSDEILKAFDQVIAMTYLFEYSYMASWYALNEIKFDKKSVVYDDDKQVYKLIDYNRQLENREEIYKLMNVYKGKYNDDLKRISLNRSGYTMLLEDGKDGVNKLDLITKTTRNFLDSLKEKGTPVYWTTFKNLYDKNFIKPRGYSKSFISLNIRATNEYSDASAIAYLIDRRALPMQKGFFQDKGIHVNENGWTVSDLLQWIYRSRIRNGEPIHLFLPSKRMRDLLEQWANYEL